MRGPRFHVFPSAFASPAGQEAAHATLHELVQELLGFANVPPLTETFEKVSDMTRGQQTAIIVSVILSYFLVHLGFLIETSARQVSKYPECVGWFGVEDKRCETDQKINRLRSSVGLPPTP